VPKLTTDAADSTN